MPVAGDAWHEGRGGSATNPARRISPLTERTIDERGLPLMMAHNTLEG